MIGITIENAAEQIKNEVSINREDIARAKDWLIGFQGTNVSGMVSEWLREQAFVEVTEVNAQAQNCSEQLSSIARAFSVRLAFYHGLWELVANGDFVSTESTGIWEPSLCLRTPQGASGVPLKAIQCPFPSRIHRLVGRRPLDTDIFLKGINCNSLHSGIHEAIDQSLACFRRGLYMPATVMLAAAAEGMWTESANAIAESLSVTKLQRVVSDPFISIAKVVSEVPNALENNGKHLLDKAGLKIHQIVDAEIWTTALRERRNALHWGKAKSFTANHSETGTLLMAAPQHLGALEKLRLECGSLSPIS